MKNSIEQIELFGGTPIISQKEHEEIMKHINELDKPVVRLIKHRDGYALEIQKNNSKEKKEEITTS